MKRNRWRLLFFTFTCTLFLSGCNSPADSDTLTTTATVETESPSTTKNAVYDQMTLFILDGFRSHDIDATYHAYFQEIIPCDDGSYSCEILLENDDLYWSEFLTWTYNSEKDWYTFTEFEEPILTQDAFYATDSDDGYVKECIAGSVWETDISIYCPLTTGIRFDSPKGPISSTSSIGMPHDEHYTHLYIYRDQRTDVHASILYPQIYLENDDLEEVVNQKIKDAFFYGYYEQDTFTPQSEFQFYLERDFQVTRFDEQYFSCRIYEYNSSKWAIHPNEWETAITINLQTGEILTLTDVIGDSITIPELLAHDDIHCLWYWRDNPDQETTELEAEWKTNILYYHSDYTPEDFNDTFYLTEDALGIITRASRYYTCMEIKFESLALKEWAAD